MDETQVTVRVRPMFINCPLQAKNILLLRPEVLIVLHSIAFLLIVTKRQREQHPQKTDKVPKDPKTKPSFKALGPTGPRNRPCGSY